jgi:hypothetical protein
MAIISNLVIDQGTTFSADIDVTDRNGNIINLNNYTTAGQIRKNYNSSTSVAFTTSVFDANAGTVRIQLSSTQTGGMKAGRYVYDVEITSSDNQVTRIIEGQVEITPQVTRAS